MELTVQEFQIRDLNDDTLIAVQDPQDERHIFIRPIEKTPLEEFYTNFISASENMVTYKSQVWDIDLQNEVASKVGEDEI